MIGQNRTNYQNVIKQTLFTIFSPYNHA